MEKLDLTYKPSRKISVVVADDHALIRIGIKKVLEKAPDIFVVGESTNGLEAIQMVEIFQPDVLILDIQMPKMDGIEVLEKINRNHPNVNILVITAEKDSGLSQGLMEQGVKGCFYKDELPAQLVSAVYKAVSG